MSREKLSTALSEQISGQDLGDSRGYFENQLKQHRQHLEAMPDSASELDQAKVQLEIVRCELGLNQSEACWQEAKALLPIFIRGRAFQEAAEACELMYLSEQDQSILALAHGVWLSVTYPVDPELTVDMLHYIVEQTPADSDGAAVAAVAANYIADLRAQGQQKENLSFLTKQIIAKVAKRHRDIEDEEAIKIWIEILELNDLDQLFPRLGKMLDVIVGQNWWFDRDELRAQLPVN